MRPADVARLRAALERVRSSGQRERETETEPELNASWQTLRAELDDEAYDVLRYATHTPNRVGVLEVFADSPGAAAGLQPGDIILRYDSERIFEQQELINGASRPRGAGSIRLEVERAGQRLSFFLPSGRIGLLLDDQTRPPRP